MEADLAGQPRVQRPLVAQFQAGQQILIPDEHQGEGGLLGQVQPQQQAHLLQAGLAVVLGLVQDDHQDAPLQLLQSLLDQLEVGWRKKEAGLPNLAAKAARMAVPLKVACVRQTGAKRRRI